MRVSALGQRQKSIRQRKGPSNSPGVPADLGCLPCTWDCWKLFPGAKWKFPATCGEMPSHPPAISSFPFVLCPLRASVPSSHSGRGPTHSPAGLSRLGSSCTLLTSRKPYTWQPSFFCSCIFWLKPSRRHCSMVSGFLKAQPRRRYASRTSSQELQHLRRGGAGGVSERHLGCRHLGK